MRLVDATYSSCLRDAESLILFNVVVASDLVWSVFVVDVMLNCCSI